MANEKQNKLLSCLEQWKESVINNNGEKSLELLYRLTALTEIIDSRVNVKDSDMEQLISEKIEASKKDYLKNSLMKDGEETLEHEFLFTNGTNINRKIAEGIRQLQNGLDAADRFRLTLQNENRHLFGKEFVEQEKQFLKNAGKKSLEDGYQDYLNECVTAGMKDKTREGHFLKTDTVRKNADAYLQGIKEVDPDWLQSSKEFEALRNTLEQFQEESFRTFAETEEPHMGLTDLYKTGQFYDKILDAANAYLTSGNPVADKMAGGREIRRMDAVKALSEQVTADKEKLSYYAANTALHQCNKDNLGLKGQTLKAEIRNEYKNNMKVLAVLQGKTVLTKPDEILARESMKNLVTCGMAEHLLEIKTTQTSRDNDKLYAKIFPDGAHFNPAEAGKTIKSNLGVLDQEAMDVKTVIFESLLRKGKVSSVLEQIEKGMGKQRQSDGPSIK